MPPPPPTSTHTHTLTEIGSQALHGLMGRCHLEQPLCVQALGDDDGAAEEHELRDRLGRCLGRADELEGQGQGQGGDRTAAAAQGQGGDRTAAAAQQSRYCCMTCGGGLWGGGSESGMPLRCHRVA